MGTMRAVALGISLVGLLPGALSAAELCRAVPFPKATVAVELLTSEDPPIDRSLNLVQLTMKARERGMASARNGRVAGLTEADFRFSVTELKIAARDRDGTLCVAPASIRLKLQTVQKVYIINSSHRDACWQKAILDHEFNHVAYNNEAVRATGQTAEQRLGALSPVAAPSADAGGKKLVAAIDNIVQDAAAAAFRVARDKHAALDHPRAYQDMRAQCDPGNRLNEAEGDTPRLPGRPAWRATAPGRSGGRD